MPSTAQAVWLTTANTPTGQNIFNIDGDRRAWSLDPTNRVGRLQRLDEVSRFGHRNAEPLVQGFGHHAQPLVALDFEPGAKVLLQRLPRLRQTNRMSHS